MATIKIFVLILISISTACATVVNTTIGLIRGMESPNVELFLGIPYAEAPEGPLRFKPPVRKAWMEGVYNASTNTKVCPQFETPLSQGNTMTEDCLRLDIYKPLTATKLPVMIWVHGGGYYFGDSRFYSGVQLASEHDVIVVALNYRLGILGFLNTMDDNAVGNFGLRDQCSAIEWFLDNIDEFGGDASRVTIFGESAGSSSVLQLALSSLCKGKFQRVIAQSGTPFAYWTYNNDPLESARKLAASSGCPAESGPFVTCLREKSIDDIIGIQGFTLIERIDWGPTYTSDIFPENPLELLTKGENSDVLPRFQSLDVLLGVMAEEGELEFLASKGAALEPLKNLSVAALSDDEYNTALKDLLKVELQMKEEDIEYLSPAVKFLYTDWENRDDNFSNTRMYIRLLGDASYMKGAVNTAQLHSRQTSFNNTGKTYFYNFRHKSSFATTYPWTEGATHFEDIPYVFGLVKFSGGSLEEQALSQNIMEYWTNFAKTGDPNSPSRQSITVTWPQFAIETQDYLKLDVNMSPDSVSKYPYARRFAFWDEFFPSQLKALENYKEEKEKNKLCKPISAAGMACFEAFVVTASIVFLFLTS